MNTDAIETAQNLTIEHSAQKWRARPRLSGRLCSCGTDERGFWRGFSNRAARSARQGHVVLHIRLRRPKIVQVRFVPELEHRVVFVKTADRARGPARIRSDGFALNRRRRLLDRGRLLANRHWFRVQRVRVVEDEDGT